MIRILELDSEVNAVAFSNKYTHFTNSFTYGRNITKVSIFSPNKPFQDSFFSVQVFGFFKPFVKSDCSGYFVFHEATVSYRSHFVKDYRGFDWFKSGLGRDLCNELLRSSYKERER